MTLWQEFFNPPVPCEFTPQEFNQAWSWLFSDMETAPLKQSIILTHSLRLKRAGHAATGQMALTGLWRRSGAMAGIQRLKLPVRRV